MQPSDLRAARKALKLNREAFAKAVGLSAISIARMETGAQPIKLTVALAVEALLSRAGLNSAVEGQSPGLSYRPRP